MRRDGFWFMLLALFCACSEKPTPVTPVDSQNPPETVEAMTAHLSGAYKTMDLDWFAGLLADDAALPEFRFDLGETGCAGEVWGREQELQLHERMFSGEAVMLPAPFNLATRITGISATLTRETEFAERFDLYADGIDESRFQVVEATYSSDILFETDTDNTYLVEGRLRLLLVTDEAKAAGEPGRVTILAWEELGPRHKAEPEETAAVEELTWAQMKLFYASWVRTACPATSKTELVQRLAIAYREKDRDLFERILANDPPARAEFLFITAPSPEVQDQQWGYAEEARIHRRMFTPWDLTPGDTPVPDGIWLVSVNITLTQETPFYERADLYESAENPEGLSPVRWRVQDAIYGTYVLWDMQGEADYAVGGRANFVVLEDLDKAPGAEGKFRLLQWNDLDAVALASVSEKTWSEVKNLYR